MKMPVYLPVLTLFVMLCSCLLLPAQMLVLHDAPWFEGRERNSSSCAWGDVDGDGDLDLFVTNGESGQGNEFYENMGDGRMRFRPELLRKPVPAQSFGSAWGDYDNDGDLDLYVANADYIHEESLPNWLYRNDGNLEFTLVEDTPIATDLTKSYAAAWVDFDNDGDLDLSLFSAYGQPNRLYRNDGTGQFNYFAGGEFSDVGQSNVSGSWADFDNDGDADCLVIDSWRSYLELFRNKGNGEMELVLPGENALAEQNIYRDRSASWADINNDGWLDVVIRRTEDTPLLFINDGTGDFYPDDQLDFEVGNSNEHYPAEAALWGDFDADGDMDLQLPFSFRNFHHFYRNDGAGNLSLEEDAIEISTPAASYGLAAIDYDLNGDLDYFQTNRYQDNGDRGVNQLYTTRESPCGQSVQIDLRGETSNSYGVGSRVWVYFTMADGAVHQQMQEVMCLNTGGYSGQNGYRLYFGLGEATQADSVRVEWTSGAVQYVGELEAGQLYELHESGEVVPLRPYVQLSLRPEPDPNNNCHLTGLRAFGNRGLVSWTDDESMEELAQGNYLPIGVALEGRRVRATDFCGRTMTYDIPDSGLDLELGPNPTTGTVFIRINSVETDTELVATIYNAAGQLVYRYPFLLLGGEQVEELPMGRYPAGTYIVEIEAECRALLEKVVVVRD